MKQTVSFDYDGTLSTDRVQKYALNLLNRGVDVIICTRRYNDLEKHKYALNPTNEDMYEVLDKLGIPKTNIFFTNMESKVDTLRILIDCFDIVFHLENEDKEIYEIVSELNIPIISTKHDFEFVCEEALILHKYLK